MNHLYRISKAAALQGIPRQTIDSAIARGEIDVSKTTTACGLRLIDLDTLAEWWDKLGQYERRGPKHAKPI